METIDIKYIRTEDVEFLVAALKARNTYLQGLINRQLNYRPTTTRNRKLEALEAEQQSVERLLTKAYAAQYDIDKMKPISDRRPAPTIDEQWNQYFKTQR